MHFGLFLVRKGTISASQFVAALESQLTGLVPIGQLAIEDGMLNMQQVFRLLRTQTDLPVERFGDAAIDHGLLTEEDLAMLLMRQSDRKRPFQEILIEDGVLTEEQARMELAAFRRERERSDRAGRGASLAAKTAQLVGASIASSY